MTAARGAPAAVLPPVITMPSEEIANIPPNSHDVGLLGPSTATNPIEPRSSANGSSLAIGPAGTARSGSGGGCTGSSPPSRRGTVRGRRTTSTPCWAPARSIADPRRDTGLDPHPGGSGEPPHPTATGCDARQGVRQFGP